MRKTAIILAILIAVVTGALVLGPRFVDLDRYRPEIAAKASAALGRPVTLAGPISLSLLPNPHVTVADVRIANLSGGAAANLAQVREVEATVALSPLFAGRVEVTSLRFVEPRLALERFPDGRVNWSFAPAPAPAAGPTATGAAAPSAPLGGGVRIARLVVENGAVTYSSGGATQAVEHVNLTVTGDAVAGPLHAEGGLTGLGATVTVSADVGRLASPSVPLSVKLGAGAAAMLNFNGALDQDPAHPGLKGKLALASDDLPAAAALAGIKPMPPLPAKALRLAGDVTVSAAGIAIEGLTVDLGDLHGTGAISADAGQVPALDVKLKMSSLDLDRLLGQGAAPAAPSGNAPASAPPPRSRAGAAPPATPIALPSGINANIDFAVDAVQWRAGAIRNFHLTAALANGNLAIKNLSALLPGGSSAELGGSLDAKAGQPHFSGTVKFTSDNLRDFLRWAGIDMAGVPPDRLRRAVLGGTLDAQERSVALSNLDLTLDAAHITGAAGVAFKQRPAVTAQLAIDQLNLDAYLGADKSAPKSGAVRPAAPNAGVLPPASEPSPVSAAAETMDANFDISVETLIVRGQTIRKMRAAGTLLDGDITLREVSVGDLGGASGKASGYAQHPGAANEKAELAFDMRGPELSRVMRLLAPDLASADVFGAFTLGGAAKRDGDRMTFNVDVEAAGGKIRVAADATKPDTWDATVALDHPSYNRLMHLVSPSYRPQGGELGPVRMSGKFEWTPSGVAVSGLDLEVGGMKVAGDARLALAGRPKVTATLSLGDLALDRFLPIRQTAWLDDGLPGRLRHGVMLAQARSGTVPQADPHWSHTPIDVSFLRLFDAEVALGGKSLTWGQWRVDQPQAKLDLKNNVLAIPQLAGKLFGGALAASANVDVSAAPAVALKAALTGANLKQALAEAGVSLVDGSFDVQMALAASGASPFDLISHLNGDTAINGRNGTINGVNLPAINDRLNQINNPGDLLLLIQAGRGGSTKFSSLTGTFKVTNGVAISNDLRLEADGGEGTGNATIDFPKWTIASRTDLRLTGAPNAPPIGFILSGPLDQPSRTFDTNAIQRYILQRAVSKSLQPNVPQLPGTNQPVPGTTPPTTTQPQKPQDILRNILKAPH